MTDVFVALALALIVILGTLLFSVLGHLSACGLENLTRKKRKGAADVDEDTDDTGASRETTLPDESGQ